MNIISTRQLIINSLLIAFVAAALIVCYDVIKHYFSLPVVYQDQVGVCVTVVVSQNGEAYNCNDVNITLRKYRSKTKG